MLYFVILLIFGSGIAFVVLQNTASVNLSLLSYTFPGVPLYSVMIGSLLTGALLVYIIHLIKALSFTLKIHGRDKKLRESEKNVSDLIDRIHHLEQEKEDLKKKLADT